MHPRRARAPELRLPSEVWVDADVQTAAGVLLILGGWVIGSFGFAQLIGAGIALQRDGNADG